MPLIATSEDRADTRRLQDGYGAAPSGSQYLPLFTHWKNLV